MPPHSLLKSDSNKNFLRIIKLKLYMTRFFKDKGKFKYIKYRVLAYQCTRKHQ